MLCVLPPCVTTLLRHVADKIPKLVTWADAVAIKEKHCYVRARAAGRAKVSSEMVEDWTAETHRTRDGGKLKIPGAVRTLIPEALFNETGDPFGALKEHAEWEATHFVQKECAYKTLKELVMEAVKKAEGGANAQLCTTHAQTKL